MIVIADTGPINYLLLIGEIDLLPLLYSPVLIPSEVQSELMQPGASETVRRWARNPPAWLIVYRDSCPGVAAAAGLDAGERAAIELAIHLGVNKLLVDEKKGRRIAIDLALEVQGTLGILEAAAHRGAVDLEDAIARLLLTNFLVSDKLIRQVLKR